MVIPLPTEFSEEPFFIDNSLYLASVKENILNLTLNKIEENKK